VVLGHLGVNVPDLAAAKGYYDRFMPLLDYTAFFATTDEVAYRPADEKPGTYVFLYPATAGTGYSRHATGLQHLAFVVKTRSAVRAVHEHVARSGDDILHAPQHFPEYPPPYYATFWLDPFGLMLEAVCHRDAE
jgi:catechol 2,3-dioxygenase-like lactoylglutathione lyase family enzyme